MAYDSKPGTNKLARVLKERMGKEADAPLVLDFGEIQADGSLVTNTFPVPVPRGDYSVCRHVGGLKYQSETESSHTHIIAPPSVKAGDRVLVAWVQDEAVVIDVIKRS